LDQSKKEMAKTKKPKSLYDVNGRWVEERGRIKGAIRRAFRLSPQMKEVLQTARVELTPALKKDGTPGKRSRVRYRCAMCGELFSQKNVQVDHIENVVPLWKKEADMTYDEIVRGIFCDKSNLQVLCSTPMVRNEGNPSCHRKKTNEENWIRKQYEALGLRGTDRDGIQQVIERIKKDYIKFLAEKEAKKNARRSKKSRKRKRDSSTN